jgi:hypothetical protein
MPKKKRRKRRKKKKKKMMMMIESAANFSLLYKGKTQVFLCITMGLW